MASRAGAQTLCCNAPATNLETGTAAGTELGAGGSLESAPASGEVEITSDTLPHHEQQQPTELHRLGIKAPPFGSLDSASTVASTAVKGSSIGFCLPRAGFSSSLVFVGGRQRQFVHLQLPDNNSRLVEFFSSMHG